MTKLILIDDRVGSADLMGHLRHWGVPCQIDRLEFGDACFTGNGKDGPVAVGIEVKKVHDVLQCIGDGRFAGHQLPGLVKTYDRVWLIVEGEFYPRFDDGILVLQRTSQGRKRTRDVSLGPRTFMYSDLSLWLATMEICAGIRVRRTSDRVETARVLADLHRWWSKDWGGHKAHLAFHEPCIDVALLTRPPLVRIIAKDLPGVGWEKSKAVARRFRTVRDMVEASEDVWREIPGIGEVLAARIVNALTGAGG